MPPALALLGVGGRVRIREGRVEAARIATFALFPALEDLEGEQLVAGHKRIIYPMLRRVEAQRDMVGFLALRRDSSQGGGDDVVRRDADRTAQGQRHVAERL